MAKAESAVAEKAVKKCECGCGGITKAHFVPGHDSKHKSKLFALAMNGTATQREKALKEIKDRKWYEMYKKSVSAKSSKFVAKNGKAATKKVAKKSTETEAEAEEAEEAEAEEAEEEQEESEEQATA